MNAVRVPQLQIVILAAGFSSRLRQPKALARVRSRSLLQGTLALVAPFSPAKIIVVLPPRAARYKIEARGFNAILAANPHRAGGLSSSVRRGVAMARYSPALLLLPVDLAILQSRDIARLIRRWRGARRCVVATRVGPRTGMQRAGVPLILPRRLYAGALAVKGDIGLRELVNGLPPEQRVLVDLPSADLDVDTPQDLRAARRGRRACAAARQI
jgi:molybdenum cofactor cytidylyltransferase